MYFFLRGGWEVQFFEPDLKTPLCRKFTFADPEKIRELARRGEAWASKKLPIKSRFAGTTASQRPVGGNTDSS
jgi:hypothetical protein